MKIDLHIHTKMSDGAFSPKEVVDMAYDNGVEIMSITDHDTIEAYNDEIFEYAKSKGIKLIQGVEISTKTDKVGIHVLGYNYDLNNQEFKDKLYKIRNARHIYLHDVGAKLAELGYKLNVEELDKIDSVTKAHISLDIINNDENKELLMKNFGHIPNKGEFIEAIMNENCPAYVRKASVTPKEAAEIIRSAGGKVVLAHPVAYVHEDSLDENDIQVIVDSMKPDGIEANYIYVDSSDKIFNEVDRWKKFSEKNNLFTTAGSDFHNIDYIRPEIGFKKVDFSLKDEEIEEMVKNLFTKCSQN